jgi:ABC-type nickel/cobalt efflux system permease component RcnA
MNSAEWILIGSVVAVGVLHTVVPDHWLPIVLMARQRNWSKRETTTAALQAGTGHVISTLLIAILFWAAGAAVAARFSQWVETATSFALVAFGLWVGIGAWRETMHDHRHGQEHDDAHGHTHAQKKGSRTALLLILGSSPMVEGIPAFFAAGKYGLGLLVVMAIVFALSTVATYVLLSLYSAQGLQHVKFGRYERYGEMASGFIIAAVGVVFWFWPIL